MRQVLDAASRTSITKPLQTPTSTWQQWGRSVPASDIYALGATLIHLLTGISPFYLPQRDLRIQFTDKVSLSPSFVSWLQKLTEPAPEHRFSSARQALSRSAQINVIGHDRHLSFVIDHW